MHSQARAWERRKMKLPDLIGMYLDMYVIKPIGEALNVSENIIIWILIGIGIIIFGYWIKLFNDSSNRASPPGEEPVIRIRKKRLFTNRNTIYSNGNFNNIFTL